jgi:hypothetical protein
MTGGGQSGGNILLQILLYYKLRFENFNKKQCNLIFVLMSVVWMTERDRPQVSLTKFWIFFRVIVSILNINLR